jgi:hypothetical protein
MQLWGLAGNAPPNPPNPPIRRDTAAQIHLAAPSLPLTSPALPTCWLPATPDGRSGGALGRRLNVARAFAETTAVVAQLGELALACLFVFFV